MKYFNRILRMRNTVCKFLMIPELLIKPIHLKTPGLFLLMQTKKSLKVMFTYLHLVKIS